MWKEYLHKQFVKYALGHAATREELADTLRQLSHSDMERDNKQDWSDSDEMLPEISKQSYMDRGGTANEMYWNWYLRRRRAYEGPERGTANDMYYNWYPSNVKMAELLEEEPEKLKRMVWKPQKAIIPDYNPYKNSSRRVYSKRDNALNVHVSPQDAIKYSIKK